MEKNKLIFAIILLGITLMVVFFFALPEYQKSIDLENSLAGKQIQYEDQSAYYEKISTLLKEIKSRPEALNKIDSALPSKVAFAPIVYFLQKEGVESGLKVKSVTFSRDLPAASLDAPPVASKKEVTTILFTLYSSGNYKSLKNFLYRLEKSARIFEVSSISFGSTGGLQNMVSARNPLKSYDFKMEIKTHSY